MLFDQRVVHPLIEPAGWVGRVADRQNMRINVWRYGVNTDIDLFINAGCLVNDYQDIVGVVAKEFFRIGR